MFERILNEWKEEMSIVAQTKWFERMARGDIKLCHYKGYLRETYHHAGLNPQIQAFATMYFQNNPRSMINLFYGHARQEICHDLLALSDLEKLGENTEPVKNSKPLPSTLAFNAFAIYLIQFVNPVSYLGYLFHLEYLPTQNGKQYIEMLLAAGVPANALTFLEEHSTVDIAHNEMMKKYITNLIKNEKDLNDVIYAVRASCILHGKMISDALEFGEKNYSA